MRKRAQIGVVVVGTCLVLLAALPAIRYVRARPFAPFAGLARAYLERAIAGDSAGLAAMSANGEPVTRALALARSRPADLRRALETLRLRAGARAGADTVVTWYEDGVSWCSVGATSLQVTFVRAGSVWKVQDAGLGPC